MTLDEASTAIGAKVFYEPTPGRAREVGVITSVGVIYVFVRYAGDRHSKATSPAALTFLSAVPA